MVKIPVIFQSKDDKEDVLRVERYILNSKVFLYCGNRILKLWELRLDLKRQIMETNIVGVTKDFEMRETSGNHYGAILETKKGDTERVYFLDNHVESLTSYKAMEKSMKSKIKEVLIVAYRNKGWMSLEFVKNQLFVVNVSRVY